MRLLAVLSLLTIAGCFDPDEPPCTFSCAVGGVCPGDYMCLPDGYCHLGGKPGNCGFSDAAVPPMVDAGDMSIGDLTPPMDDGMSPDLLPPPDLMPLPTCSNSMLDPGETDVDCGGPCAPALTCADTKGCLVNGDCTNGYCRLSDHTCRTPTCSDVAKNGSETDVDCGGSCVGSASKKCAFNKMCSINADCIGGSCPSGTCVATCTDTVKDGTETGVDCGGSCAPGLKCADTVGCAVDGDCTNGYCRLSDHTCRTPTCADGVKNGGETGTDCGGTCVATNTCGNGMGCVAQGDCTSGFCSGNVCFAASCNNGTPDVGETDTDCGGTCPKCADTKSCLTSSDCTNANCLNLVCQPFSALAPCGTAAMYTLDPLATSTIMFNVGGNLLYTPMCLTVHAGTMITFQGATASDTFDVHPLTPSTRGTSGNPIVAQLGGATSVTFTFGAAGFFPYFCAMHGNNAGTAMMSGVVQVIP